MINYVSALGPDLVKGSETDDDPVPYYGCLCSLSQCLFKFPMSSYTLLQFMNVVDHFCI